MKISTYSAIGRRINNEDYLAYKNGIFILCDGVGGSEKGEVASRFVTESLLQDLDENLENSLNEINIQLYIAKTQYALNLRLNEKPDESGMGTTLALLILKPGSGYIAHIGDSRVYFMRPLKQEYWHTKDHSLVQQLVDAGIITEAKTRTHPKKNIITRAIQANFENKVVNADIVKLNEIEAGDLFFLCSDGVMEAFDDEALSKILFRNDLSIEGKLNIIKESCADKSSDNNTAILIEIEAGDMFDGGANENLIMRKLSKHNVLMISETEIELSSPEDKDALILGSPDIDQDSTDPICYKI